MNIIIFGASGRTGKLAVKHSLSLGYKVKAYIRNKNKLNINNVNLEIIEGDIFDINSVINSMKNCDAVISAIGPVKSESKTVMSTAAKNILEGMRLNNIPRLIWQTGAGIIWERDSSSASRKIIFSIIKFLSRDVKKVLDDSTTAFNLIADSNFEWTIVRVPILNNKPKAGGYKVGYNPPKPKPLSREDVAEFLINQLKDTKWIKNAPFIGY